MVSSTGSAPTFRTKARSLASVSLKEPVIWPDPPVMADCTVGADSTARSRMMASSLCGAGWLTRFWVMVANFFAPDPVSLKSISHPMWPLLDRFWLAVRYTAVALEMASPVI